MVYAVRHGLTTQAIVARVHASVAWPAFYALFVVAVAIHAPLGLRAIVDEWLGLRGAAVDVALGCFALVLLGGGLYAVASLMA
jgi:fumarate reductase subunit C